MIYRFHYHAALESIDPERNRFRRYEIQVEPDLFGGFSLRTWRGRIGGRLRPREERIDSLDALLNRLAHLLHVRIQHGYVFR